LRQCRTACDGRYRHADEDGPKRHAVSLAPGL
jgi:hypothetical protein